MDVTDGCLLLIKTFSLYYCLY